MYDLDALKLVAKDTLTLMILTFWREVVDLSITWSSPKKESKETRVVFTIMVGTPTITVSNFQSESRNSHLTCTR